MEKADGREQQDPLIVMMATIRTTRNGDMDNLLGLVETYTKVSMRQTLEMDLVKCTG